MAFSVDSPWNVSVGDQLALDSDGDGTRAVRSAAVDTGAWHALALSLPLDALAPAFVWPATELSTSREDSMLGPVPVGQHVALPATTGAEAEIDEMRDDIDTIRALLQCSTNVSEGASGGPGTRRQPDAPPFD